MAVRAIIDTLGPLADRAMFARVSSLGCLLGPLAVLLGALFRLATSPA